MVDAKLTGIKISDRHPYYFYNGRTSPPPGVASHKYNFAVPLLPATLILSPSKHMLTCKCFVPEGWEIHCKIVHMTILCSPWAVG